MSSHSGLQGKVAVVTGASKGIGAAIAKALAAEGAAVVVDYARASQDADRVVAEIEANGGRALAVQADVADRAAVRALFDVAVREFGRLDVLVNNAGLYRGAPLDEVTEELFREHFDLNVLGLLFATQEAVRRFGAAGGTIVNVSSVLSTMPAPGNVVYAASKGAVDAITRTLARELAPRRIRVNSVNPGLVATEGTTSTGILDLVGDSMAQATPLGRVGLPADIAAGVVFLAGDASRWVTGESLYLTGGLR